MAAVAHRVAIAAAVAAGSELARRRSRAGSADSIPIATAFRSCSAAAGGPSVSAVVEPPWASTSRSASSTAHSSCGLIVKPR